MDLNDDNNDDLQVLGLFPTPVLIDGMQRNFTEEELKYINSLEKTNNMGNTTSLNKYVLESEELKDLKTFLEKRVNVFFEKMYVPEYDVSLKITQSWTNYTEKGQWHHKHTHANSFLSGVLYISAQEEKDRIVFYDDGHHSWLDVKTKEDGWHLYNSRSWWLGVKTGQLIIFPSNLTHEVAQVETDETRISLSFNTFLKGYVGNEDNLTALHL